MTVHVSANVQDDHRQVLQLPPWVAFSLVHHQVRSARDAQDGLLRLIFEYTESFGSKDRPALLILSTHALAHFDILKPMREVVEQFLSRTIQFPVFHFNALLRGLSGFTRSEEAANLAVSVLEAMTAREVPLWPDTYRSLMRDRFVTLQLTKVLHTRMAHEGVVPTAEHLEAFLRVFSNNGAIQDSQEYLRAIRTTHPANTLYIGSLRHDRASAFHYLHKLLQLEAAKTHGYVSSITGPSHRHASTKFWSGTKIGVDIFDWTTALVSAANDKRTSASALVILFERARERTKHFRPTVVTYTVLLRGLLFRGAYNEALSVWNQLLDSGIPLDRKALTVGVQVLTRAGHPQDAFYLLNSFMRAQHASSQSASLPDDKHVAPVTQHWINIIVINEFMVSLLRTRRPDVIFQLWDNLEQLYSVLPNEATLNILLKAAVLATKMDNESVRGAFAHLFHAHTVSSSDPVDSIVAMLHSPHPPSVVGIWRNRRAGDVARDIFRTVMYGNWKELLDVKAPASIVHSKDAETTPLYPLIELAKSITMPFSSRKDRNDKPGTITVDAYSPDKKPYYPYPSIVPTDVTFSAYIQLLGLTARSSEISLALAWMRALQIRPSRKTLSIALVFWAEVSLRGPLFEEWAERRNRGESEYGRLVRWMGEWVGEEAPTDGDMQKALRAVAKMRDSSFGRS
ncbi:hypothetical protein M405DRAFT_787759 [Rhizopogon salebrosus TDB-379]|nr:hypothetical protein M405DRAFT_787759 [Rhizopogon salebrosus TDB-379]